MSYISFYHVLYDFARTFIEIVTNQVLGHFKKNPVYPNCQEISLTQTISKGCPAFFLLGRTIKVYHDSELQSSF